MFKVDFAVLVSGTPAPIGNAEDVTRIGSMISDTLMQRGDVQKTVFNSSNVYEMHTKGGMTLLPSFTKATLCLHKTPFQVSFGLLQQMRTCLLNPFIHAQVVLSRMGLSRPMEGLPAKVIRKEKGIFALLRALGRDVRRHPPSSPFSPYHRGGATRIRQHSPKMAKVRKQV